MFPNCVCVCVCVCVAHQVKVMAWAKEDKKSGLRIARANKKCDLAKITIFHRKSAPKVLKWPPRAPTAANRPQVLHIPKHPYRRPFQPRCRFLEHGRFWRQIGHFCEKKGPGEYEVILGQKKLRFALCDISRVWGKIRKIRSVILFLEFLRSL